MSISAFDLFTIGIGPSSSHTVGPMRAARRFTRHLLDSALLERTAQVGIEVYGSLAATGAGHGTFTALLLGMEGHDPATLVPVDAQNRLDSISQTGVVRMASAFGARHDLPLRAEDICRKPSTILERHTNGMRFQAIDCAGTVVADQTWYSIGGGFIVADGERAAVAAPQSPLPYPFRTAAQLLTWCASRRLSIAEVMLANERTRRPEQEIRTGLAHIWTVMQECTQSAIQRSGYLPGGLKVARRAPQWYRDLDREDPCRDPGLWLEWVNLVALAVNEENASGGRVVTAPTNGAAGIIPAVLHYATHYSPTVRRAMAHAPGQLAELRDRIVVDFLLTAAAIGVLYKEQASISGAEVGCQGEVGSAASMAAAGLAAVMGGTAEQVENAAEIAMEHNLGLTCDPIGGLVQIPCIERNAIAAGKAINASRMALRGDGTHRVTLDQVIATMRETGKDMSHRYKETALGGLAVNVVEC